MHFSLRPLRFLFFAIAVIWLPACGDTPKEDETELEEDLFIPDPLDDSNVNPGLGNPYDRIPTGGTNSTPPPGGGDRDDVILEGDELDPGQLQPGQGEGEGSGQGEGEGEGEGEAEPPEEPVETPAEFEGKWTFYNYCVIAEDRVEAINYIELFPNELYFEAWLKDIQVTVSAIRQRLPYGQDGRPPQDNCLDAYNLFKTKVIFSLAPDFENGEVFDIVNIDPISGLPGLRGLNLRKNKIVNMTFLRNLTNLRFLDLSQNLIEVIPPLRRTQDIGLIRLAELSLEYQGEANTPLDLGGLLEIHNVKYFQFLRIKGNIIDPSQLRFFTKGFRVSTTRVLKFLIGRESCEPMVWGFPYPDQLEEKRKITCGDT